MDKTNTLQLNKYNAWKQHIYYIWADDACGVLNAFWQLYYRGIRKRFQTPKRNKYAER